MKKLILALLVSTASFSALANQYQCYYDYNHVKVPAALIKNINVIATSEDLLVIVNLDGGHSLNVIAKKTPGTSLYRVNKEGTSLLTQNTALFLRNIRFRESGNVKVELQYDLGLGTKLDSNLYNCEEI